MHIIIAPDSFKGSVSALGAATAIEKGFLKVFPDAAIWKVPIADGGEGTVEALVAATGGQVLAEEVMGPLGETVKAGWGILGDGETAVIEMAAASGLPLVPPEKRDPRVTTTYGTGQLIKAALDKGMKKLIIGIGGSATNDGGSGMLSALGMRFLDGQGRELPGGGSALAHLAAIDASGMDRRLAETKILAACDVDNPLCGPRGASAVFGPQKGATPEIVQELDQALGHYAGLARTISGKDVAEYPGAGAAGGLGAGLLFFTNALLRPGVEIVLDSVGFRSMLKQADLVITGEGSTDFQTAYGKAPVGVAKAAKQFGVPVICLSGGLGSGAQTVLKHGIDGLMSIVPQPMPLEDCIKYGAQLIEMAAERLALLVKVGMNMRKEERGDAGAASWVAGDD